MLGHLCALYDRGVFEAARLMSNLIFQLAVPRRMNTPLLAQLGWLHGLRVVVDAGVRAHTAPAGRRAGGGRGTRSRPGSTASGTRARAGAHSGAGPRRMA